MTTLELQRKIDKFEELINGFGEANSNGKILWQMRSEIIEHFKVTTFEDGEEMKTTKEKFESLSLLLYEKQDAITSENEKYAAEAEQIIKEIESTIGEGFYSNNPDKESIIQLKSLIDKAFEYFKQPRWPSKESRAKAWDTFNSLRENLRKEEDAYYSTLREKRAEQSERSHELTSIIIEIIEACHPDSATDLLFQLLQQLTEYLIGIGFTPESVEWILANKEAEPKSPLKMKSEGLREVRRLLNENRDEITRDDRQRIYAKLESISSELNKAWDLHREEQQRKQQEWEEKKKLNEQKKTEWLARQGEFLKVLEEKWEKRTADKANLERILTSKKEFSGRQQARLQNQTDFLQKITEDLADMQEKVNTAYTESFKERMAEKIAFKEAKIAEVKSDIEVVKGKLIEVEKDITDITEKLENIDKSLSELQLKKEEVLKNLQPSPPQS